MAEWLRDYWALVAISCLGAIAIFFIMLGLFLQIAAILLEVLYG